MKKWNKITMVPLASDLKIMKEYLISKANSAVNQLKMNFGDKDAYTTLLETIFRRVLLLNRRRPGELQRVLLHIYERCGEHPENYEEFSEMITPSEKILRQRFKRIVIRGKRGRGVPVLFSSDIQEHIGILLKYRSNYVSGNNVYLFGNPTTIQPICGYKVINKFAKLAGTRNPQAMTATKLRKHLATLTQVLNMSANDIEQLSTFMGHIVNVYRGSYRLPDDLYQTAKISKLLLLMEKREAAQYKGKSLDEMNIDLDEDLNENDNDSENEIKPLKEELNIAPDFSLPENTKDSSDTMLQLPCKISILTKKKQATGKE
ncbi:hypothetical protein JTB14_001495 [Gonioctena quinquepunctata]|nr:hypothetical protein JTB14_001495 [Gonioctena quinquepunctata]